MGQAFRQAPQRIQCSASRCSASASRLVRPLFHWKLAGLLMSPPNKSSSPLGSGVSVNPEREGGAFSAGTGIHWAAIGAAASRARNGRTARQRAMTHSYGHWVARGRGLQVVLTPVAREIPVQVERSAAVGILSTGRDAMVQWRTFIQRKCRELGTLLANAQRTGACVIARSPALLDEDPANRAREPRVIEPMSGTRWLPSASRHQRGTCVDTPTPCPFAA